MSRIFGHEIVEFKGEFYHMIDGKFVMDANRNFVPDYVCICEAHNKDECICGAWELDA